MIAVPGGWGYGTSHVPWCRRPKEPYVGRPGAISLVGCVEGDPAGQDPGTLLTTGGTFVWLDTPSSGRETVTPDARRAGNTSGTGNTSGAGGMSGTGAASAAGGMSGSVRDPVRIGERETFDLEGVRVVIQAPAALRERIRSSVRVVERDHNDCPVKAESAEDPGWRPDGPPVGALRDVSSISACQYAGGELNSSVRVDGERASDAIEAIASAPVGGGPNMPRSSCGPDDLSRVEHIVLHVRSSSEGDSSSGAGRILLRYGGCFHRGMDDGTTVRTLTRAAVAPFVVDGNRVTGHIGENLSAVLDPPER